jgi:hypothetical protein
LLLGVALISRVLLLVLYLIQALLLSTFDLPPGKVFLLEHLNHVIVQVMLNDHLTNIIVVNILLNVQEHDLKFVSYYLFFVTICLSVQTWEKFLFVIHQVNQQVRQLQVFINIFVSISLSLGSRAYGFGGLRLRLTKVSCEYELIGAASLNQVLRELKLSLDNEMFHNLVIDIDCE